MSRAGFWDDPERAREVIAELKALKATIEPIEEVTARLEDARVLVELHEEQPEEGTADEIAREIEDLSRRVREVELLSLLRGPHDAGNCYFTIQAGAGGTESQDWAAMLLRMYLRYCERMGFEVEELSRKEGEEAGIQHVHLLIRGPYAYGLLSCERGVHRLERISPFNAQGKRQTSFAAVDTYPELGEITVEIDWDRDVREDTYRASGAGGQHVNKTSSAVRLTHLPTGIVVQCQNDRSQHKNRAAARRMLVSRLYQLEQSRRDAEMARAYSEKGQIGWGYRIRTYTLDPYKQVKDERTGYRTPRADEVLDGDIQPFIEAELRRRARLAAASGERAGAKGAQAGGDSKAGSVQGADAG